MAREKPPTAISTEGNSSYEEEFRMIGKILQRDGEAMMKRWFERANQEQVHASTSEREEAMNDLVETLHSFGQRLEQQSARAFEIATEIAQAHGKQRAEIGWDVLSVVRDYEILHGVVLEHLGQVLSERLTYRQAMIIASLIDRASGSAVKAFSEMTHQKLESQVKRQQAELRRLILELTGAEHSERQRIAQVLHDDFQQILVAARMRLGSAMRSPSVDSGALQGMQELLDQMLEASRDLSRELHPAPLATIGLPAAIESLADLFQRRHGLTVTVELNVPEDADFGSVALRSLIYNGIREMLFNVVKHANTDRAWVRSREVAPAVREFEVEDRGKGFSPAEGDNPATPTGLGLSNFLHRIEQVGGSFKVNSDPGRGTRISFTVPLKEEEGSE